MTEEDPGQSGVFCNENSSAGSEHPMALGRDQSERHWERNSDVATMLSLQGMFIACLPEDFFIIARSIVRILRSGSF